MKKYVVTVHDKSAKLGYLKVHPTVFNTPQDAGLFIYKEAGKFIGSLKCKHECIECHSDDINNGTAYGYHVYNGYENCGEDCIIECEVESKDEHGPVKVIWTQYPVEV